MDLQIISTDLLSQYNSKIDLNTERIFEQLHDSPLSIVNFSFYTSVSSVFSSKIEGEDIEVDSFIKHKRFGVEMQKDYTRKIDDLYDAYLLAQKSPLNEKNINKAHSLITKHILPKNKQGKVRTNPMFVLTDTGKIEYVATEPSQVSIELKKLYQDIDTLIKTTLSFNEVLFFASMIHLVFVKIHPFEDGNGRTGRLLEKWFLSEKLQESPVLREKAWFVQSEKYYYNHHQIYYNNIRMLGLEYDSLNYKNALSFLLMLPSALIELKNE